MSERFFQGARLLLRPQPPAVYAAQIRSLFEHLPLTMTVSVINGLLLVFVLASVVSATTIVSWIALVVILSALRVLLWFAHYRIDLRLPAWAILATTDWTPVTAVTLNPERASTNSCLGTGLTLRPTDTTPD